MRLLDIIFYLLRSNSKVTIKELAREYNVSTRTIQRDLDKLSVLGIPIMIYRGKNGGVELDNNYVIRRQMLKYNDYESLIFALYISKNISKDIEEAFLIDKFKSIDEIKYFKTLDKLKKRFIVDLYEEKIDTKSDVCKTIDKALDNKYFVEIEIKDDKISIFPISYVLRKEGLFLYYWNKEYNVVSINDIYNVKVINKSYDGNIISYRESKKLNLIEKKMLKIENKT